MSKNRIVEHPVLGNLDNQTALTFTFEGNKYTGYEGDTIASALHANGIRRLRVHEESGTARGIYCNIGHCFECRLTVDQTYGVRACMTEMKADLVVATGNTQATPFGAESTAGMPRTYAEFADSKEADPHVSCTYHWCRSCGIISCDRVLRFRLACARH